MYNERLSTLALRVFRAEENLHIARNRNLSVRITKRRERAVEEAMAKLTSDELASERARRAKMNGF